ncbi:uncharacterized protein LOC106090848 [Stomoxys calcitrans]|uniref:Uncharacterized protein n=1 Tax=Stomoxys calcitrans TaxID=35570 RepID=A0A1I8PE94_STOCA|nr:uncharacterized protein LOC106090848 [Stomoxys calcitrans]
MDSKDFAIDISKSNNEWFLVQYDEEPHKLTRKIVKFDDLIWNEELQNIEYSDAGGRKKEHVLIRDQGKLHLGCVIYKACTQKECIDHHTFLQIICMQLLYSPHENGDIMDRLHFNHSFWLLVMYSRSSRKEEQVVYAVLNKNDVIIKMDQSNALMAFVQEGEATYKGQVVKITNDLSDMIFMMDIIRNELVNSFQEQTLLDPTKKFQEFHEKIAVLDNRMYCESKLLLKAFQAVDKSKMRLEKRLEYLQHLIEMNQ